MQIFSQSEEIGDLGSLAELLVFAGTFAALQGDSLFVDGHPSGDPLGVRSGEELRLSHGHYRRRE